MLSVKDITSREAELSLVAGKEGLDTPVVRAHMVESAEIASSFVGGGEIVFTTGAGLPEGGLLEFIRLLQSQGASGVVVNLGLYIPELAPEVIAFAEEKKFPLFCCSWEVRMAEIIHRISFRIEESVRGAGEMERAFRAAAGGGLSGLRQLGFGEDTKFYAAVLADGTEMGAGAHCFEMGGVRMAAFADTGREDIRGAARGFAAVCGPCQMKELPSAFRQAKKLALLYRGESGVRFLDESGICQLLLGIEDRALLERYCCAQLGKLAKYDAKKGTELTEVLDTYIRCGTSLKEASELLGVHRNTVMNRVKKCGAILGRDLAEPAARIDIEVALLARRILALPE